MDFLFYNFQTIMMGSSTLDRIISSLSPPHHVQEQYPDQRHLHCPPYKEPDTIKFNTHTKRKQKPIIIHGRRVRETMEWRMRTRFLGKCSINSNDNIKSQPPSVL